MPNKGFSLLSLLLLALLAAACTAAPQPAPSATSPAASSTAAPSLAPSPSLEPSAPPPSPTPAPSLTPTPSPLPSLTPTATITPTSLLTGLKIEQAEYRYSLLSLTFRVPGIQLAYRLQVSGQPFTCQLIAGAPDLLVCSGPYFPAGQSVKLAFFDPASQDTTPLFQATYVVRPLRTATVDPYTLTSESCPVRGIQASCETENRIADNGKCTVSTCVDKCGFWYAVDTCYYKTPYYAGSSQTKDAKTRTAAAKP